MTTLREAAQMALQALQESKPIDIDDPAAFYRSAHAIEALRAALANEFNPDWDAMAVMVEEQQRMAKRIEELESALAQPEQKLWLWKNFVDGRPEYWAFDNPYPTNLDNGDPQTLGQPCGYAIFKPSRDGSCGRTEEQVLREMKSVTTPPKREWIGLTLDEIYDSTHGFTRIQKDDWVATDTDIAEFAHIIEARLKAKNT